MSDDQDIVTFVNGHVPCAPFEKVTVDVQVKRGMAGIQNRVNLVSSRAIAGAMFRDSSGADVVVDEGATVFVRSESVVNHPWATCVMQAEGLAPFVLVPIAMIVAVR